MSKTFCPLPWNSVNMRNNGDLRICCNTNSYSEKRGILFKEDGVTPFNAGKDDWNDARNSSIIKEVRVAMLNDEWHPECERCRQEEVSGIKSRREYESIDWKNTTSTTVQNATSVDGHIDTETLPIEYIDIRYGNFCNLKCRMCGPTDSHQWYDDHVKLHNKTTFKDTHGQVQLYKNNKGRWQSDEYSWFQENPIYWDNFDTYAINASKLYIVGGEPLIIDEHTQSLEKIVASGNAGNIELEYNTNLTVIPDKLFVLWKHFKEIRIGASIDGIGDVFNYQRNPANFDQVYKNMLKLENNPKIKLKGWLTYTITPLNVFHFVEFMKWKLVDSNLIKFNSLTAPRPIVTHHMCHSPKHYNIKVLPIEIKLMIKEHYMKYIEWALNSDLPDRVKQAFVKISNGVIKFMMSEDYSKDHLSKFISVTNGLDKIRNQNILDIVPQYEKLFT